jgi:glycosyltransferase involved in cell wall biosynthesis
MVRKIALLPASDLSKVQGSTEANYVAKFLAENYDTHVYSRFDPEMADVTYHEIPNPSAVPALLLYNIVLLPYFLYQNYKHGFDIFYTYSGFHLTPFVISRLSGCDWIADFQTKPTGQAKEWAGLSNTNGVITRLYYKLLDIFYALTLPYTKAIITLSEPIRDDLRESYNVAPERIQLIPLGVDSAKFSPERAQAGYTAPLDIVYMGSITSRRGIDMCIRTLASEELDLDVRFHLVGGGPDKYLQQLREIARKSDSENRVEWHGYVDHNSVPEILNEMDAAISPLPAHDSYEVSSPAKVYEYLSMGLPIICSDIRAHNHLLTEDETGFFFEPDSQTSLVAAINHIGRLDWATWQTIREETRHKGIQHDWSNRMETIQSVIEGRV